MEQKRGYTTVSIPIELSERVKAILKRAGYSTISDFTRDAIRRLLEEKEKEDAEKEKALQSDTENTHNRRSPGGESR